MPSRSYRLPAQAGVALHELLAEEATLKKQLLLIVIKLQEMARALSGSVLTCPQSEVSSCEAMAIQIHSLRTGITGRLKSMSFSEGTKKRLLRLPLRFDRVAGMLWKIAEAGCRRADNITFGPGAATEIDLLFSKLIKILKDFHDHLQLREGMESDQCVKHSKELLRQAQDFRVALCNGWHVGFCFTKETHAYWESLDLMIAIGTSLEEAAVALLELEGGTEKSDQSACKLETQKAKPPASGSGYRGPPTKACVNGQGKEKRVMTPKRILFCTDFSENSKPARRLATEYAEPFGATLILFHVIDPGVSRYPRFEDLVPLEETLKSLEQSCDRELKAMREEIEKGLPWVKAYSVSGVPAKEIVSFAREEGIDLIVMGTHGWTGLSRLILGSTAENVLRTATCPVLIVRSTSVP
jgi:nucleotide-binding universal stress UspA family protein